MKKSVLLFIIPFILSSCTDTSLVDSIAEQQSVNTVILPPPPPVTVTEKISEEYTYNNSITDTESSVEISMTETETSEHYALSEDDISKTADTSDETAVSYDEPDLDLTEVGGNIVYAQVYDMMFNGDDYLGQIIKVKGRFGYYKDEDTGEEFFGVVVSDAAACCSQGIEFVLDGEHTYPDDYPPLGTEMTVTGVFNYYTQGYGIYLQLMHAVIEIDEPTE